MSFHGFSLKAALLAVPLLCFAGCTHSVHMVHASDFSPYEGNKQGKLVSAKSEQFVILNFAGDTNYVEAAYRQLQEKCRDGDIRGVTTEFITSHSFLSYKEKIYMKGRCVM